jgi:hypothetical protein
VVLVYHRVVAGQRDPFELCVTHFSAARQARAYESLYDDLAPPATRAGRTVTT